MAFPDASGLGAAEGVGFEPTEACASLVFKTSTFVRSVIPPDHLVWYLSTANGTLAIADSPQNRRSAKPGSNKRRGAQSDAPSR